ncbi:hypothetical protein NBRC111894_230 [Sporolactobacillus inulinus]|uniref:Uncharacterized protein n=1 Tax=Sporolactobacillus inulinus TaxID=2078 RepID=A0A4Y1Z701_9BACL|nr:hypothetical protein NBRC111894_230 [Sporolactobacillus inulinus]
MFGEPQDAAFYRTTYTHFLKYFVFLYFPTSVKKAGRAHALMEEGDLFFVWI